MIVRVLPDSTVVLEDPDTFTAFHVEATGLDDDTLLAAFGGDAASAGPGELWLGIDRLRALGDVHGGPDWRTGCEGMLAFAETKGWIDSTGTRVRAHVER